MGNHVHMLLKEGQEAIAVTMKRIAVKRLTDAEAEKQIKQLIPGDSIYGIKTMPKEQRDAILNKVKEIEGLRQRQAACSLGISQI